MTLPNSQVIIDNRHDLEVYVNTRHPTVAAEGLLNRVVDILLASTKVPAYRDNWAGFLEAQVPSAISSVAARHPVY